MIAMGRQTMGTGRKIGNRAEPVRLTAGWRRIWLPILAAAMLAGATTANGPAQAQDSLLNWQTDLSLPDAAAPQANTTVLERQPSAGPRPSQSIASQGTLRLSAHLTADGQRIDRDIVWRVFRAPDHASELPQLLTTKRIAEPELALPPGRYIVNAAFGRAHLTREIALEAGAQIEETFILNAGGLRLHTLVANAPADPSTTSYRIYEGERDQAGNRALVMDRAKPGLIIRLNSGLYRIESVYGDANARVRADVTVEAGKLTEATISHAAARIAFKLVDEPGGEALPGTHWTITTSSGDLVKRSVGALPSHVLAPGDYVATARWSGQSFKQAFSVVDGQSSSVEVLKR